MCIPTLDPDKFFAACTYLQLAGVTEYRVTPELCVALARHAADKMECITGLVSSVQFAIDDEVLESRSTTYYRGIPFRLSKDFK